MKNNASRQRLTGVLNCSRSVFSDVLDYLTVYLSCLIGLSLLWALWSLSVLEAAWDAIKRWFTRSCVD